MESLPHSWSDQVDARNNGRYDKWLDHKHSGVEKYKEMPLTLGCYTREDIPFYYSLADAFTVCDHNFCSSLTGTTPNRLYFWSGTIREKHDENVMARVWNSDADEDTPVSWTTFPERLEENDIPWKIYQNEVSTNSGLKDDHDSWLSNFTDNPIEFFSQYNVKADPSALSGKEKSIHEKAFTNNKKDPAYRELTTLKYKDGDVEHEVKVPKGDVLHQFREDVNNGTLPTVSWLVAPQAFSDHPSSAWYGAWYISEVMDILTKNPEVWKKTIFILTYDENDGYFDHVPPFVSPHPHKEGTGKVSQGMNISEDYVASAEQQSSEQGDIRTGPIGLGYRVPMVIASPWSRGGWVNSQVFDHTSSLLFLEKFLSHRFKKKIEESNISDWRRTVCGDLTSVFRPYHGEKLKKPEFLQKDVFIESIHKAQFRNAPSNFRELSSEDLDRSGDHKHLDALLPVQEKGIRDASALPYELYAGGGIDEGKKAITIQLEAASKLHGSSAAGSAFTIYAPGTFRNEQMETWSYALRAGDKLEDQWQVADFQNGIYHLRVYGPNGFYRELKGDVNDPSVSVELVYGSKKLEVRLVNNKDGLQIVDNAYKSAPRKILPGRDSVIMDLSGSYGWYDFSITADGKENFIKRYAGRVENGKPGKTDPFMGRMV